MNRLIPLLLTLAMLAALSSPAPGASRPGPSDWNQWRGPNRDGLSPDTGLLKEWPSGGPTLVWKATGLGEGFSSVSIAGKRIFTMGDVDGASSLIALEASDGKILWTTKIGAAGGNRNAGTRSTPATDGTLVFALGQAGELVAVEAESGKIRWEKNLEKDFGGRRPGWWWSESPLLDGDRVVCTPGGSKGTVLALQKATGQTIWQSADLTDRAHYTSLLPAEIGGVHQYIVFTDKSVAGVSSQDGKLLWRADRPGKTAVVPTPIYKDGIVFVTSGYGVGCNAFKISADGGQFKVEELYSNTQMINHHGGVVLVGDYLYGLSDPGKLKCMELKTGKVLWEERSVGKGSIAYADGHLVVRSENQKKGEIAWVEATSSGYKEMGRFTQPDLNTGKQPTWAHPVIFGGRLYIRDQGVLLSFDLKSK